MPRAGACWSWCLARCPGRGIWLACRIVSVYMRGEHEHLPLHTSTFPWAASLLLPSTTLSQSQRPTVFFKGQRLGRGLGGAHGVASAAWEEGGLCMLPLPGWNGAADWVASLHATIRYPKDFCVSNPS